MYHHEQQNSVSRNKKSILLTMASLILKDFPASYVGKTDPTTTKTAGAAATAKALTKSITTPQFRKL